MLGTALILASPALLMTHLTTRRMCHTHSVQLQCEWLIRAFVFVFDNHPKAFVKQVKTPKTYLLLDALCETVMVLFRSVSVDSYLSSVQTERFSKVPPRLMDVLMHETVSQVGMSSLVCQSGYASQKQLVPIWTSVHNRRNIWQ